MPLHPAWVKNISRRVLWAALERDITKEDRRAMQKHFGRACAYCGAKLAKRWHADHLLPVDKGGYNHISNRVPACARCNEQEKREKEWAEFLSFKCGAATPLFVERKDKIQTWRNDHLPAAAPVTKSQRAAWKREVNVLALSIDSAWERLKRLKNDKPAGRYIHTGVTDSSSVPSFDAHPNAGLRRRFRVPD